jgi:hypothetical protein
MSLYLIFKTLTIFINCLNNHPTISSGENVQQDLINRFVPVMYVFLACTIRIAAIRMNCN